MLYSGSMSVLGTEGQRFNSSHSEGPPALLGHKTHFFGLKNLGRFFPLPGKGCKAFVGQGLSSSKGPFSRGNFKKKHCVSLMEQLILHGVSLGFFLLGLWGLVLNRTNILVMLLALELMLLGINMNFFLLSIALDDRLGLLVALLVLTVAAAESSIGLALFVVYYRVRQSLSIDMVSLLRG